MSLTTVAHTLLALALVVSYTILTALGHDGSPALYILGGQAAGGMIQATKQPAV